MVNSNSRKKRIVQKIEKQYVIRKRFLQVAFTVLVMVILCFLILYSLVKRIIKEQSIESAAQQFLYVQEEFDTLNEQVNIVATQVLLDDICSEWMLAGSGRSFDAIDIGKIRRQLALYQNANYMVDSIFIYNKEIDKFISSNSAYGYVESAEFRDQGIVEILEDYDTYYSRNLFRREAFSADTLDNKETVYTYILNYSKQNIITSAIIINIEEKTVLSRIANMQAVKDSQMVIIDEKGNTWAEISNGSNLDENSVKEIIEDKKDEESGYLECSYGQEKYYVSWARSDKNDWYYLLITQWESLFQPIIELKWWACIICMIILAFVMGEMIIASVYINHLDEKLKQTKVEKSTLPVPVMMKLNEDFLDEFLHKKTVFAETEIDDQFAKYGFGAGREPEFTVLLLQKEGYNDYVNEYGQGEAHIIKYGFLNAFEEIFSKDFFIKGFIDRDNSIAFVLSCKHSDNESIRIIEDKFRYFCEKMQLFVEGGFSLLGSMQFTSLYNVPDLLEKLYEVKEEPFFYPSNSFLIYENVSAAHQKSMNYRKLDVRKLTNNFWSTEDSFVSYKEFVASLDGYRYSDYMNVIVWLGVSIVRSLKESCISDDVQENKISNFLMQLTKCEKKEQVDKLFEDIFSDIVYAQEQANTKRKVSDQIEEIQNYIKENYSDMNIGLEYLGDKFNISANYLGRIFKKEVGMTVSEYLNYIRIQKVIIDLEQTKKPIKDIAESCGFASINYFYTYFKKKMGLTPQAYRQQFLDEI